ncbi:DMT family transporter [Limosilactobacillus mucosae]|uniref:Integral membrane protein domain protein n=2 Tax=Limosilactobacillus mucosae TaxID=97478 RepID=A0A0R1NPX7_LIMMU|nr:DMT family transporter [Limosilactobacillus mucosae]KRL22446.1 integral membrane protein domain protein [Limosilactobacillus mucosae DSM 13345]QOL70356.1 DMT family transporter [Limosilactobacillus mucosae]
MTSGVIAGITWALETLILGIALKMAPFISTQEAITLAPFVSTFIHDGFSAIWATLYNSLRGNEREVRKILKTQSGKFVILAAIIGGPVGMTGYVLTVNNLGPSIGAVASAIFPAVGAVLAYFFLKEKMQWYQWMFLVITLLGVYGLSNSSTLNVRNLSLGLIGIIMCTFGWGIEAVILAKSLKNDDVKDAYALQIRQTTSAIVYGGIILPIINGWPLVISLFTNPKTEEVVLVIALAGLFATISYLFYYKAISKIGPSKAMALDVTYAAWAVIFTVLFFHDVHIITKSTIVCTAIVLVCGILSATDYRELI